MSAPWVTSSSKGQGKRLEHAPNKNGREHNFIHRLSCSILTYSNGSLLIKPRKAFKTFRSILSLLLMNDLGQIKKLWTHRALNMYSTKDLCSLPKPRSLFEMWSNRSVAFVEGATEGKGKRGVRKGKWNASTNHFPNKTDKVNCQYVTNTSRGRSSPWMNLLCLSETVKLRSLLSNDIIIEKNEQFYCCTLLNKHDKWNEQNFLVLPHQTVKSLLDLRSFHFRKLVQYYTGLFMMFNNIQKCINSVKIQKRDDKKITIKFIMKRKHEVYAITFPK